MTTESVTICILGDEGRDPSGAMWEATLRRLGINYFWLSPASALAEVGYRRTDLLSEAATNPYAMGISADEVYLRDDAEMRKASAYIPTGATFPSYGRFLSMVLDDAGLVQPNQAASAERARDKWATHVTLSADGLPVPAARLVTTIGEARQAAAELVFPLVVKEPMSYAGRGVRLAKGAQQLAEILSELELHRHPLMIEQYVECNATDKRVVVLQGEVVGVVQRKARKGEFRSNLTLGARGLAADLTTEEESIAKYMALSLDLEFVGLDIARCTQTMPDRGLLVEGSYFCIEGNPTPGICGGLYEHTGIDISPVVVERLLKRIGERSLMVG